MYTYSKYKKARMTILKPYQIDQKTKNIIRNKKGYFIMINRLGLEVQSGRHDNLSLYSLNKQSKM